MAEEDKEKAEKLLRIYHANLTLKLQQGKSLTGKELKHLQSLAVGGDLQEASPPEGADEGELSEEIGIPKRFQTKRHYTLSPEARAQRRNAARGSKVNNWKHGKSANSFLGRLKPCHATCQHYPCEIVAQGGTVPGGVCLDKATVIQNYQTILNAVKNKDYEEFNELAALTMSESIHTLQLLMEDIMCDGTVVKREKYKDGLIDTVEYVPHPSLMALPKLMADLGITPAEFMITPRAIAKQGVDEEGNKSIGDFMSRLGQGLKRKPEKEENDG